MGINGVTGAGFKALQKNINTVLTITKRMCMKNSTELSHQQMVLLFLHTGSDDDDFLHDKEMIPLKGVDSDVCGEQPSIRADRSGD